MRKLNIYIYIYEFYFLFFKNLKKEGTAEKCRLLKGYEWYYYL